MHRGPTSVSANEGSSIRERTQWCAAAFNIEDVWWEEAFSHFFQSKNKHIGIFREEVQYPLWVIASSSSCCSAVTPGLHWQRCCPHQAWLRTGCCHIWLCPPIWGANNGIHSDLLQSWLCQVIQQQPQQPQLCTVCYTCANKQFDL